jgi:hypothetical protein
MAQVQTTSKTEVSKPQPPDMINYRAVPMHNGRYRYQRKTLTTPNSTSVNFTASGTEQLIWTIPANIDFNLSRFRIEGFMNFGAEAAKAVWVHENPASFIDRITLTDGSGNNLIDLANASNFVAAQGRLQLSSPICSTPTIPPASTWRNRRQRTFFPRVRSFRLVSTNMVSLLIPV